jgi:hypothetical protein
MPPCIKLPGIGLQLFRLFKQKEKFYDAENVCQEYGGHLASFSSLGECLSIAQGLFVLQQEQEFGARAIWTGAIGQGLNKGYSFTDGTPWPMDVCTTHLCVGKKPWYENQPSEFQKNGSCLYFAVSTDLSQSGHSLIDNGSCSILGYSNEFWFLCKF